MRIVLQQKDTGLYFRDAVSWTRNSAEAMDFLSSAAALEFCSVHHLQDLQLVFKFAEQQFDIVIPVNRAELFVEKAPAAVQPRL